MRKILLLVTFALVASAFSVVTANNASPTTKSEKVDVIVVDNDADLLAVIESLNVYTVRKFEPCKVFNDLIQAPELYFEFYDAPGETAYLMPTKLKNKIHLKYLCMPVMRC